MSTFLELVNLSILESGAEADELTSSDFASPTDSVQRDIKRWVAKAWKEIQMEINNWEYKSKQAQLLLYPRLLVVEGDRSLAPPFASAFEGDDTGATFEVIDTILLDGVWAAGTAQAIIEYSNLDGEFKWNELYDETAPTPANTDVFRLKWWGRYDLKSEVADLFEPITTTFFLQTPGGSTTQDNTAAADNGMIRYIPWADFLVNFEGDPISRGRPYCFTETPDGQYDFYPRMDMEYVLTFTYSALPQVLVAFDDEVEGLEAQYHDIIAWRAVMYWADKQERPSQFRRAERRYESYMNRMSVNKKPKPSFAGNPFNGDFY